MAVVKSTKNHSRNELIHGFWSDVAFDLSKPAEMEEAAAGHTVDMLLHRELVV